MIFIFSQFICICGLISFVISMQQKSKKKVLIWQIISFLLYAIQYLMLDAYSGMTIYILNAIRNIIIYVTEKKEKNIFCVGVFFIIVSIIIAILQFNNIYDILPSFTSIINIIFIMQTSIINIKMGQIIASSIWIFYDVLTSAYVAAISEFIIICSIIFWFYENKNKKSLLKIFKEKIKYYKIKWNIKLKKIKLLDKS